MRVAWCLVDAIFTCLVPPPQELDPGYEPTDAEVEEYAKWLGMQLPEDEDLLYIAREGAMKRKRNVGAVTARQMSGCEG